VIASLKAAERKRIRAIVLRINSPGGSVAACQEIYAAIVRLRDKGVTIVASMGDVAASGGVYIAMAAAEIIANPGTITGSIGVIIRSNDLSSLYDRIGITPKVVKSGKHKDMLATYRAFSKDEELLLQGVIDDTHRQFVEVVASGRKKSTAEIESFADGRILSGRQALGLGLIDSLGDLEAAVGRAASLAGLGKNAQILRIEPRKAFWQKLISPITRVGEKAIGATALAGIPLWLLPSI